jgi:copper/silver efflux system protein
VRGLGYIKSVEDIEKAVVAVQENVPIRIQDIGKVSLGPSTRRGALDKDGAEVVGGVVVARYGANPLQVINNVKDKIKEISPGLPKKTLANGVESQLTIVPFYDRSGLIYETLGTLEEAISLQILIVILVVIVMVYNLRASFLISSLLPISVLMVFIAMRYFGVDANIVALSGIAIAIGTMVDLGVILSENIIKHVDEAPPGQKLITTIYNGASEVSSAILTAVSTTIVSFIPVFTMQAAEGKLFGPLAFTKTFALIAALIVSLFILPMLAHWFFGARIKSRSIRKWVNIILIPIGITALLFGQTWGGLMLLAFGIVGVLKEFRGEKLEDRNEKLDEGATSNNTSIQEKFKLFTHWILEHAEIIIVVIGVIWLLAKYWLPLGPAKSLVMNVTFVALMVILILGFFTILEYYYKPILKWCLNHKVTFLLIPSFPDSFRGNYMDWFQQYFWFCGQRF